MRTSARFFFLLIAFFWGGLHLFAQPEKKPAFRSPLDIPLYLAGNFAELRSNHFHTGIDIKTQGVEGKAVYAVEDGYISRIKISTSGYGKAIYIRHPNGYTSVYAHLKKAAPEIEAYIQKSQYARESFTIELFPEKDVLPVKKGDYIARSGNTGSSGGPHLHFELRETASEEPVNPLLFGFPVTDNIRPQIKGVRIYPQNENSWVTPYPGNAKGFAVQGNYGKYSLVPGQDIEIFGEVGFAVHTYDLLNGYPNKCGILRITLYVDSLPVFEQELEKLNFSTIRYVNTYTDYALLKELKLYYHKQFIGKNNKLRVYPLKKNNGIIRFSDGKTHNIKYVITDSNGNTSELKFRVKALDARPEGISRTTEKKKAYFTVEGPNFYMDGLLTVDIPPMALYDDLNFDYNILPGIEETLGKTYLIGDRLIPLQKNIQVTFHRVALPEGLENKALFVLIDEKGKVSNMGGAFEGGQARLKTRTFGRYGIAVDTLPPKIVPLNIFPMKDLSTYNTFSLEIHDNLAGIDSYRGTIDGKWILMEYEPKKKTLTYRFDNQRVKPGEHRFELTVTDAVGNKSAYSVSFIR